MHNKHRNGFYEMPMLSGVSATDYAFTVSEHMGSENFNTHRNRKNCVFKIYITTYIFDNIHFISLLTQGNIYSARYKIMA